MVRSTHRNHKLAKILKEQEMKTIKAADDLKEVFTHIRYEGKVSFGKNLRRTGETVERLADDLKQHIEIDDDTVFPYLSTHVPKYSTAFRVLSSEHRNLRIKFDELRQILGRMKKKGRMAANLREMKNLWDSGIYLVCLLRTHTYAEAEKIRQCVGGHLRADERNILRSKISSRIRRMHERRFSKGRVRENGGEGKDSKDDRRPSGRG